MAARKPIPVRPVSHKIYYADNEMSPPSYCASCTCGGWVSDWDRSYMVVERKGRQHITATWDTPEGRRRA